MRKNSAPRCTFLHKDFYSYLTKSAIEFDNRFLQLAKIRLIGLIAEEKLSVRIGKIPIFPCLVAELH